MCRSPGAAPGSLGRLPKITTPGTSAAMTKKMSIEARDSMIAKLRTGTIDEMNSDPNPAAVVRLAQNTAGPAADMVLSRASATSARSRSSRYLAVTCTTLATPITVTNAVSVVDTMLRWASTSQRRAFVQTSVTWTTASGSSTQRTFRNRIPITTSSASVETQPSVRLSCSTNTVASCVSIGSPATTVLKRFLSARSRMRCDQLLAFQVTVFGTDRDRNGRGLAIVAQKHIPANLGFQQLRLEFLARVAMFSDLHKKRRGVQRSERPANVGQAGGSVHAQ